MKNLLFSKHSFTKTYCSTLGGCFQPRGLRKSSPGWSSSSFGCGKHMGGGMFNLVSALFSDFNVFQFCQCVSRFLKIGNIRPQVFFRAGQGVVEPFLSRAVRFRAFSKQGRAFSNPARALPEQDRAFSFEPFLNRTYGQIGDKRTGQENGQAWLCKN